MEVAGPLGTPLGLAQRAPLPWAPMPAGIAWGTWVRVRARFVGVRQTGAESPQGPREELGQESKASSCVKECNFTCLSSCSRGDRPLVDVFVGFYII